MSIKHKRYAELLSARLDLSPSQKLVLQAVGFAVYEDTDSANISHSSLESSTGLSRTNVQRCITALEHKGLFTRSLIKNRAPLYHFPLPPDFNMEDTNAKLSARIEEHQRGGMSQKERLQASVEAAVKQAGFDSLAAYHDSVFDGPEDKAYHESLFAHCFDENGDRVPGTNPGDVLRALLKGVGKPLPYDPAVREDGLTTPQDRYRFDQDSEVSPNE